MARTKAGRVAEQILCDYVESRALPPGGQLPGIRDLQQIYGVSSTAISHALSMLEARGLIWKRHGKGCFLSDGAHDGENGGPRTGAIGLVIPLPASDSLLMNLFLGVERVCNRACCTVMVGVSGWQYEHEREQVARLVGAGCRAVIINPVFRLAGDHDRDYLARDDQPVPLVLVDMAPDGYPHSRVLFDNIGAGYHMTRHLLGLGHERIAFIKLVAPTGELLHRSNHERLRGFREAMAEAGRTVPDEDVWELTANPAYDMRAVAERLCAWSTRSDRPTAVIAVEDSCAMRTVAHARELGIAVPDDLAVAGFDSLPVGASVHPPFPTTRADFAHAGEVAARLALRHVAGDLTDPVTYLLPVPLDPRDGVAAGADPVHAALQPHMR